MLIQMFKLNLFGIESISKCYLNIFIPTMFQLGQHGTPTMKGMTPKLLWLTMCSLVVHYVQ